MQTKVTTLLFAVLLVLKTNASLIGYDCSKSENIGAVSSSEILPACDSAVESRRIWSEIIEIKQTKTVVAYQCSVKLNQSDSNLFKTEILGRSNCLEAHTSRRIELYGHTINIVNDTAGSIQYDNVTYNYQISLIESTGIVDLKRNLVTFEHGTCDYNNFSCVDDLVELYWNPEFHYDDTKSVIFEGVLTFVEINKTLANPDGIYAIIHSYETDSEFSLKVMGNIKVNGNNGYRTEDPDLMILPQNKTCCDHSRLEMIFNSLKIDEYINSKVIRVESNLFENETDNRIYAARRHCETDRQEMYRKLDLVRRNSSEFFAFAEPGLIGTKVSLFSSFILQKCSSIRVTLRKTKQCFDEIPVKDDANRNLFLKSNSRVLVQNAEEIQCESDKEIKETLKNIENKNLPVADWLCISVLVFVSFWILVVIIRVVKLIVNKFKSKSENRSGQTESDESDRRVVMIQSNPCICPTTAFEIIKPPFVGKLEMPKFSFWKNRNVTENVNNTVQDDKV